MQVRGPRPGRATGALGTFAVLLVIACVTGVAPAEAGWTFSRNGLEIAVSVPAGEAAAQGTYEITVANELSLLNRLSAARAGVVTGAWIADLNGNGRFEVVVVEQSTGPRAEGSVFVHEWQGVYFTSLRLEPLSAAQKDGYAGHDRYALVDNHLRRTFALQGAGEEPASPLGRQRTLRYSFAEARWTDVDDKP